MPGSPNAAPATWSTKRRRQGHLVWGPAGAGARLGRRNVRGKSERSEAPQDDDGGRGLQMVWVYLSDAERQDRYDFWCGSLLASPNVSKENSSDAAALAQQQSSGRAMDTARRRQRTTRKRSEIQEDMTFYWKEGAFTGCELAGNREVLDSIIMVRGARD